MPVRWITIHQQSHGDWRGVDQGDAARLAKVDEPGRPTRTASQNAERMGSLVRHDAAPSHPKARSKGRLGPSSPPPNLDVRSSSRAVGKGAGQGYASESVGGRRGSLERGVVDGVVAVGERRVDPNARLCDDFLRGQRRVNTAGEGGSADVHREVTACTTRMCCGWVCGEPVASPAGGWCG